MDEINLAVADAEGNRAHDLSAQDDEHSGFAVDFSDDELGSKAGDCPDKLRGDGFLRR